MSFGISAAGWAALAGGAMSAYGGSQNKKAAKAGSTSSFQMDPNMQALLYGTEANPSGLLQQLAQQAQQGQTAGLASFGQGADGYLGTSGLSSLLASQGAAQGLQGSRIGAPQVGNVNGVSLIGSAPQVGVQHIQTTQVKAPSQNGLDLSGAFDRTINGDAGANQYLTKAIQGGIDQSSLAFGQMQQQATKNLQENILPGIKSNSIASGGFGGSRQGLAEGRAIGDFATAQQQAAAQFGQNNTNAAVGAQAQAFDRGQDRSLSALLNLSGQQYGVASQNAALDQQAQMANQSAINGTALANAQLQQGTNQMNLGAQTTNAGLQQQTALANQQAQMGTNSLNSQNQAAGIGLSSGLLGQLYGYGQNNSNAGWNRLTQGTNALSAFTGLGGAQTQTSPYYSNTAANVMGGATAGASLWQQFGGMGNSTSGAPSNQLF